MKFYLEEKRISKKQALEYISERQLREGIEDHMEDPYLEISWYTRDGYLRIEFDY